MTTQTDNPPADDVTDTTDDWDSAFDEFYEGEMEDTGAGDDAEDDDKSGDAAADDASDKTPPADDAAAGDDPAKKNEEEDVVEKTDDSKTAVKEALKEVYQEQQQENTRTEELVKEAIGLIRPEGVPDPRVDSDGDPLKSAADVEKLYNPATGEKFTPEEARAWYDQATKQYEQNLQAVKEEAYQVTQVNTALEKGREAVMRNYGDFIKENPDIAAKVLSRYMSTLKVKGQGENAYVAEMPIDILEFYNDVMYPYVELAEKNKEAEAAKEAAEAKRLADIERAKAHRDESRDLPTNVGDDATKTGDEGDWDDAFNSYYGKK
jgi:hypothetical protein